MPPPADDWVLTAVLHVTVAMQRTIECWQPVLMHLEGGLTTTSTANNNNHRNPNQPDDDLFASLLFDEGLHHRLSQMDAASLHLPAMSRLLRYGQECLQLLAMIVQSHREVIAPSQH